MDLQIAHLFPLGGQIVHHLAGGLADRADGHDHPLRVRRTVVVEQVIISASDLVDLLHIALHYLRQRIVLGVVRLRVLEIHVGALYGGADHRMVRIHGNGSPRLQRVLVHQLRHRVQIDHLDLLDLMRGAEAVKEVDKGNICLDSGQMCHRGQIHDLLHAAGAEHTHARGAAVHHVLMVAKDRVGVGAHAAGRHMQHARVPVSGNNVQARDH